MPAQGAQALPARGVQGSVELCGAGPPALAAVRAVPACEGGRRQLHTRPRRSSRSQRAGQRALRAQPPAARAVLRQVEAKRALPKDESPVSKDQQAAANGHRTKKIFVGGLPPTVDDETFRGYFGEFGEVGDGRSEWVEVGDGGGWWVVGGTRWAPLRVGRRAAGRPGRCSRGTREGGGLGERSRRDLCDRSLSVEEPAGAWRAQQAARAACQPAPQRLLNSAAGSSGWQRHHVVRGSGRRQHPSWAAQRSAARAAGGRASRLQAQRGTAPSWEGRDGQQGFALWLGCGLQRQAL